MKPLIVKKPKPRNPFVVPAMRRGAGAHRASERRTRQDAQRKLRAELKQLHPPPTHDA